MSRENRSRALCRRRWAVTSGETSAPSFSRDVAKALCGQPHHCKASGLNNGRKKPIHTRLPWVEINPLFAGKANTGQATEVNGNMTLRAMTATRRGRGAVTR
jgi:hypothetical protein